MMGGCPKCLGERLTVYVNGVIPDHPFDARTFVLCKGCGFEWRFRHPQPGRAFGMSEEQAAAERDENWRKAWHEARIPFATTLDLALNKNIRDSSD